MVHKWQATGAPNEMNNLIGILRRKSAYWGYVAICLILFTITFAVLGLVLGSSYLRSLNEAKTESLYNQAEHAVESLYTQEKSMHELSMKLSVQNVFRRSFLLAQSYNRIVIADALRQYASYCAIADEFALVFPVEDGQYMVFLSSGQTTDWPLFLSRYDIGAQDLQTLDELLQKSSGGGQALLLSQTLLFSYPVHTLPNSEADDSGFLLVPVQTDAFSRWIYQTSALQTELYSLDYHGIRLMEAAVQSSHSVSAGDGEGWRIDVNVPPVSLLSLLSSPESLLWFCGCIVLLVLFVFLLAWQCYRPLRELTREYQGHLGDSLPENEFTQLRSMIARFQEKNETLMEAVETRDMELRDYTLLMLLNNSDMPAPSKELARVNVRFPHPLFSILMIAPVTADEITGEDISTLIRNIPDLSGGEEILCAVECDRASHALAVFCNLIKKEQLAGVIRQLHIFLNHLPVRFLIADGPITEFSGISASYLAAMSKLKLIADAQTSGSPETESQGSELQQTANKLFFQIECGDSRKALELLEQYMELAKENSSALADRYNMMLLISGIYRLCAELNYTLAEAQLGTLLPSRSLSTIHQELIRLIPELCGSARQSRQVIMPTGQIVMQYLNDHFCDYDISAQSISDALGIGINRTYAIIREQTGHSLKTVLTQLRVQRAKQLLDNCSLSMAEIAEAVGYSSSSYFSKVFKASTGQSPDAYRRSISSDRVHESGDPEMEEQQGGL